MLVGKIMNTAFASIKFGALALAHCGVVRVAPIIAFSVGLLSACEQQIANAEQPPTVSSEPTSKAATPQGQAAAQTPPTEEEDPTSGEATDAELRRGYGVVDMRFNACVTKLNDHTVEAKGCKSGFVIYGPYVSVPANSDIEISFEVKPSKRMEIYADIVSQMGGRTLAGLNSQVVEAGVNYKLGYRVRAFSADANVESRIGSTSEAGTDFQITNLTMTVR